MGDAVWLAAQQAAAAQRRGDAGPDEKPAKAPAVPPVPQSAAEHDPLPPPDESALSDDLPGGPPGAREPLVPALSAGPAPLVVSDGPATGFGEPSHLLDQRGLARALRPLKRRTESRRGEVEIDEIATAERAAEDGLWLPECRPAGERWLDLDIVMDDSRFAYLHRPQLREFVGLLESTAAFRLIRTYRFDTDAPDPELRASAPDGPRLAPAVLSRLGETGRRLLLVLSDGVGEAWHNGAGQRAVALWARSAAVAIVNPLPARQWRRTGLNPVPDVLRTPEPAASNHRYRADSAGPAGPAVPVIEMTPDQLHRWTRFVSGMTSVWRGAVALCRPDHRPAGGGTEDKPDSLDPSELVRRFRAAASPSAFRLAVYLAAVPLHLRVMRHIQAVMLPSSRPSDLSEVIGSGLLRPVGAGRLDTGPVTVTHDFRTGVRAELLAAGRRSETAQVLLALADCLADRVDVLGRLPELLRRPGEAKVPAVPAGSAAFVDPVRQALQALSGPYLRPALRLGDELRKLGQNGATHPVTRAEAESDDLMTDRNHMLSEDTMALPSDEVAVATPLEESFASEPIAPFPGVSVSVRTVPPAEERDPNEPPPVWGNVPPRNINFTGREELLTDLHQRLRAGTTAVLPHALHGMGGVGKSQLAIEYVYRHTTDYDLIWWVPAEGTGQVRQSLTELAAQLGLPVAGEVNVAVPAALEALRIGRPYRNWLLIFDNAEDLDSVRQFFPTDGPGKVLVTSRNPHWSHVAHTLEVDVFDRAESTELLRMRDPDLDDKTAGELASALGDLPLAIEQAAVWLAETGMPVGEYLELFSEKASELMAQGAPPDYPVPVAAAWNVSLERLHETDPAALQLLRVCAFFAPEPISRRLLSGGRHIDGPEELVRTLADPIRLGRALRAINQYALAKISHRHNTVQLHRLVQRVLLDQLTPQETAELRHCAHMLLANSDPNDPESPDTWPLYASLLPHVEFTRLIECDDPWAHQLVINLFDFLYRWGDYQGYEDLARRTFKVWTERLGERHEQTLVAELKLGKALRTLGHYSEAYRHDLHAREILVADLGDDHERSLEAQGYICADLRCLGKFGEALEINQQLYAAARRRFGPDDPFTLEHAFFLGMILRLNGQPKEAEELDQDTHRRRSRVLGEDHLNTFSALAAMAVDGMELGRFRESRDLQRQITQRMRMKYGDSHPGTIENLNALSAMERRAGDHDEALRLSTQALELSRARYGDGSPDSVAAALNHTVSLRQAGDLAGAVELGRTVRDQYVGLYGAEHPNTLAAGLNLAVALRLMGQVTKARELNEEILSDLVRQLGLGHPRSLACAINLASDIFAMGDAETARQRDVETLEHARQSGGDDHPTTLACALNLALDLRALGEDAEAEARFTDTLARYRRVLGDAHPATISGGKYIRANCDIYLIIA
ncbi:FxSxx-COOH system tetratricopeptide repeat protein [Actinoallomurus spadix]|uniref:FxSxx-COOH system tetratricopeptide repeat protein n=1 Tax=Actinoallomurus spadix TaxID=79912 RepID=UPI002092EE28|nr:FxSxx-COOH system tetratricopeptide repeat protein [Actinoallomurus spadix]MCO5988909.1 FxSxx-COOH system tetratricopeptide repeat protein [Actinoallomurus spadix]